MPYDHVALRIPSAQWDSTIAWYRTALAGLKYTQQASLADGAILGFGPPTGPDFFIFKVEDNGNAAPGHMHWAFRAESKEQVDAFHAAGVAAEGGIDNGAPGPRPARGDSYYGAFVKDPLGNNIEIVARI